MHNKTCLSKLINISKKKIDTFYLYLIIYNRGTITFLKKMEILIYIYIYLYIYICTSQKYLDPIGPKAQT